MTKFLEWEHGIVVLSQDGELIKKSDPVIGNKKACNPKHLRLQNIKHEQITFDEKKTLVLCMDEDANVAELLALEVAKHWNASAISFVCNGNWQRRLKHLIADSNENPYALSLKQKLEHRLSEEMRRPIAYAGDHFAADLLSVEMMQGVISRVERTGTLPTGWVGWRSETNQLHWGASSPDDVAFHLQGILNALGDRTQALYAFVWGKKAEIDAMDVMSLATPPKPIENPLEIDVTNGFDLFEGWPS